MQKKHEALLAAEQCERERLRRTEEWQSVVDARRQSKEKEKCCGEEGTGIPERAEKFDIVFFHSPTDSDPLKFLKDNFGYIDE